MNKAVIYLRVSTKDKDQDPSRQLAKCKEVINNNGYQLVRVVTDKHTGKDCIFERPNGRWLKKNYDKWDVIIFFDLSRFSRQPLQKVLQTLEEISRADKKYISATEPFFDLTNPFAPLLLSFIAFINNYFLEQNRKNIISGLENARSKGKTLGRPKLITKEVEREIDLRVGVGESIYAISRTIGINYNTLRRFNKWK